MPVINSYNNFPILRPADEGSRQLKLDCSGVPPRKIVPITEVELDDWNQVINVNLTGVFNCLKYEMQHIKDGGSIVNVVS